MNILITGGAGYLGSVLVPRLLARHDVTVLDNFIHGENTLSQCCADPGFDVVKGDARDMRIVEPLAKCADAVIPLAAIVGFPACLMDQDAAKTTNYHAIANLCGLLSPSQMVIYPTTNSGYGTTNGEDYCTEDTPLKPISLYGKTKSDAERVVLERENSVTLRLATAFGASPRMRIDLLLNEFVYRAVLDKSIVIFEGHFKRNFIHVRDIASAFLHAIDKFPDMRGRPFNCGLSSANMTKIELCERIQKHAPKFVYVESEIGTDPDKRNYLVSNDRIEATGFMPSRSIDDGIIELIKLYATIKNNRYGNV